MGQVFLAQSGGLQGLEKLCVVKKLRADLTENREYVRRFLDEARVVVQLNHANICHVFDVGCVGQEYYLAMEYVAGINLRALFHRAREKKQPLPESIALFALREVLEALDYAHRLVHPLTGQSLRLVHRDVSPQNVMLSYEGETKLIDFGLAASDLKEEHTQGDVVMGKVAYMSPEQARGEPIGAQTDQFAAAVLAYELLVGERYYGDLSTHQIWQVVGTGQYRPASFERLPRKLQGILARALSPKPQDRYPTCGDFSEELIGYLNARSLTPTKRHTRAYIHELFADEIERERVRLASWMQQLHNATSLPYKTRRNPSLVETAPHAPIVLHASPPTGAEAASRNTATASRDSSPGPESTQRFETLSPAARQQAQRPIAVVESGPEFENSTTLALVQQVMGSRFRARQGIWAGALVLFGLFAWGAQQAIPDLAAKVAVAPAPEVPTSLSLQNQTTAEPSVPNAAWVDEESLPALAEASAPQKTVAQPGTTRIATALPERMRSERMAADKITQTDTAGPLRRAQSAEPKEKTKPPTDASLARQRWRDRVVKRLSTCPASCAQTLLGSSSALSTGHPLDVTEQDFQAISFTVERCLLSCEK